MKNKINANTKKFIDFAVFFNFDFLFVIFEIILPSNCSFFYEKLISEYEIKATKCFFLFRQAKYHRKFKLSYSDKKSSFLIRGKSYWSLISNCYSFFLSPYIKVNLIWSALMILPLLSYCYYEQILSIYFSENEFWKIFIFQWTFRWNLKKYKI